MGCTKSKLDNLTFDKTPTFTLEGKKTKVKILKIYDGDTLWLGINLHGRFYKFKVRMMGYDSPEIKPRLDNPNRELVIQKAKEAKTYLESLVNNRTVDAEFFKFDKYGRPLCNLYIKDTTSILPCKNKVCVNTLMVRNNHGYTYMGGKKKM